MSVLSIIGSARAESHTKTLMEAAIAGRPHSLVDLRECHIGHYEYGGAAGRDDFRRVAEAMTSHTRILLATPVYWYSMSGRMKVLFDRLTDLVTVEKPLGRGLRGRTLFVLACGADLELPRGFEVPFQATASYLEMDYGGACYGQTTHDGPLDSALRQAAVFGDGLFL